jgi:hypothetical protein
MSYAYTHLLAKSSHSPETPKPQETLIGHTLNVVESVDMLVRSWGNVFLTSLGIPDRCKSLLPATRVA